MSEDISRFLKPGADLSGLPPETRREIERIPLEIAGLDKAFLQQNVPEKVLDKNLLIATWNIRSFGGLTPKWKADSGDSPKRDFHALMCIARIVSRFDVVAIQEVKGSLRALRYLMKILGPHWSLILTDVTRGAAGNDERLAFVFDTRKVNLSGLACELVVPPQQDREGTPISEGAFARQFVRTPYAVSFRAGDKTFILVTLHVLYGEEPKDRIPELKAIAAWLSDWARSSKAWHQNIIALGDFNIDRKGDPLYVAFTDNGRGLQAPPGLNAAPRTISHRTAETAKHYDQIAWFTGVGQEPALSMRCIDSGYFDFLGHVLKDYGLTTTALSWRISDHYPLWAEFSLQA
jgi:endonuclease/exonuclease/phosphatase family metal-dependent hydrolase